jgi:hypothetical protein
MRAGRRSSAHSFDRGQAILGRQGLHVNMPHISEQAGLTGKHGTHSWLAGHRLLVAPMQTVDAACGKNIFVADVGTSWFAV